MRTYVKILPVLLFTVLVAASGCKKYEDGPSVSLIPRTERLCNTWQVFSCNVNGSDMTSYYVNTHYIESYDKSGRYAYSSAFGSGSGQWIWSGDQSIVSRFGIDGDPSRDLHILRLKEKELWYYYMDGNDRVEFHMVPF